MASTPQQQPELETPNQSRTIGYHATEGAFFRRIDWIAFATTFLITLTAYTLTLAPTVTLEDSGELVVAADYLGVPHPPGYPIWTLLAWFFQWIFHPVTYYGQPNPAWAVGFMSAFFGAAACAMLAMLVSRSGYDILRGIRGFSNRLTPQTESLLSWVGGVAGGLLFAFSSVLWSQSVIVEVYSLNAFFLCLILLLTYRWMCRPHEDATLYIVAFMFGLGLTNHQSLLFAIVGLVAAIFLRDHRLFRDCMAGGFWVIAALLFFKAGSLGLDRELAVSLGVDLVTEKTVLLSEAAQLTRGRMMTSAFVLTLLGWAFLLFSDEIPKRWFRNPQMWIVRGVLGIGIWMLACYTLFKVGQLGLLKGEKYEGTGLKILFFLLIALALQAGTVWILKNELLTQWKRFIIVTALVALGLSFYLYLPIASDQNPPMNWGYPRTEEGFWHALSRGQYQKISVTDNFKHALANPGHFYTLVSTIVWKASLPDWLGGMHQAEDLSGYTSVIAQFTWPVAIIGLIAFVAMIWLNWHSLTWMLVTIVTFLCMTVVFVVFQYPDLDVQTLFIGRVQYIQAHAIYALWISYGLVFALAWIDSRLRNNTAVKYIGITLTFLLPLVLINQNANDETYLKLQGGVEQNGHDFGWQFGNYQLRGAEAIWEELREGEEPPPSKTYPPAMTQDAIFFGGTDPGRFVPTYMIYSAKVRPDVYLITQNALADNTYMAVMRDLYGDSIWIPAQFDTNNAFRQYVDDVRSGRISAGAALDEKDGRVSVQGVQGVMAINGILTKYIFDHNKPKHDFYIEESYVIPWMYPYLTPHGLIMKINREPLAKLPDELVKEDHEFWSWYTKRLTENPKFIRDVVARKTFSKLRSALGGLYVYRRNLAEAEHAFSQAIELYDLSPEANFRLADVYAQQAKYDEAIALITQFLEKDKENDKVRAYLKQLEQMQKLDQRRVELEPRLAQGVDLATAMDLLTVYRGLGRIAQFEALGNRLLSNATLPVETYRQIGILAAQSRRFSLARTAYTQWTQQAPKDHQAWIELAATQLALRQHQEMFNSLNQAVSVGGESARAALRDDTRFNTIRGAPFFQQLVPPTKPTGGLNFGFGPRQ